MALRVNARVKICLIDESGAGNGALSVLAQRQGLEHERGALSGTFAARAK